jgi:isoquinoline 1-oxidoreductase subunit beta
MENRITQWTYEDFAKHAPGSGLKSQQRPLEIDVETVDPSRRDFIGRVFGAGTLVLGASIFSRNASAAYATATWKPSVFLAIDQSGEITIVAHRSEMGTGSRSSLPMIVADELEADWKQVRVEQALGDEKYGSQNTDGSCSVRDFIDTLRQAGASARFLLEKTAAEKWQVPVAECKAQLGKVVHKSGKSTTYGELAADAAKMKAPTAAEITLKTPSEFRYIGKPMPTIDLDNIVQGKGTFGMDAKVPGMVYASIVRSPVFGGTLKSLDDKAAKAVKGVTEVITLDHFQPPYMFKPLGGVAVIGDNTWSAMQGRRALKVEWEQGANATYDTVAEKQKLLETVRQTQKPVRIVGDVEAEFAKNKKVVESSYWVPLLSHAPMEPPVAVADTKADSVEIWAPTQNPQAVQDAVSAALSLPKDKIKVHVTLLGGGFGRKSKPDYCVEAALLSRKIGKPVKVVWTREDDIRHDYYHTCGAMHLKACVDAKGRPTAWLQRSAFPSIGNMFSKDQPYGAEFEVGMGLIDVPFDLQNFRAENGPAANHVRIGWLRAVAHIYHAFGVHSFVDELAAAANRDRVEFYLDLIGKSRIVSIKPEGDLKNWNNGQPEEKFPVDAGRLRRVLEVCAEKSGWGKRKQGNGYGMGIVAHRSFLTYVATAVEVNVDKAGQVTIPTMHMVVDAGMVVNPDRVKAQFEGAGVFGAGIAMLGEVTAKAGAIQQSNFNNYLVARRKDAPQKVHVHIVSSDAPPAGVGEPGVPPVAPAITNAIFAATGKRVRELPVRKTKLV